MWGGWGGVGWELGGGGKTWIMGDISNTVKNKVFKINK